MARPSRAPMPRPLAALPISVLRALELLCLCASTIVSRFLYNTKLFQAFLSSCSHYGITRVLLKLSFYDNPLNPAGYFRFFPGRHAKSFKNPQKSARQEPEEPLGVYFVESAVATMPAAM